MGRTNVQILQYFEHGPSLGIDIHERGTLCSIQILQHFDHGYLEEQKKKKDQTVFNNLLDPLDQKLLWRG